MKYIILIGDGMADRAIAELDGRTPLEAAVTPNMDSVAARGRLGLFKTVPDGFPPGSDVANLSILGYDPKKYYTGRAPLEAASMGVTLSPNDVAYRCNLVTLGEPRGSLVMDDYSAGHITTPEAEEIIKTISDTFSNTVEHVLPIGNVRFYPGKSYRHLLVIPGGPEKLALTPPHDITDKEIDAYLPKGEGAEELRDIMVESQKILASHPVNAARRAEGKKTADSIWLWGQGRAPSLPTFRERYGVNGAMISAVDLMNGIGVYAGLEVINVPGATGYLDTNYKGKAEHAIDALDTKDLVCVHVEAPDEAGHQGLLREKIRAIEDFDRLVVGHMLEAFGGMGEARLMVVTDHATPVELRTHTSEPVPFAVIESGAGAGPSPGASGARGFSEASARSSGVPVESSDAFIEEFIGRKG